VNSIISANFSEPMAPATLTGMGVTTFSLSDVTNAGAPVNVPGTVAYFDNTATFDPTGLLTPGDNYTAKISTAATDRAGNHLVLQYTWDFKAATAALPKGPKPVFLGAAGNYVILAASMITDVPTSTVVGDVALSPAAASKITGFTSFTRVGTFWTSPEVVGKLYAANNDPPTPNDLTVAVNAMMTAYTNAATRPTPDFINFDTSMLGSSMNLTQPGLYNFNGNVTIPANLTIAGAADDVYIFQIAGKLTMAPLKTITLTGGVQSKNIFWQVADTVSIGDHAAFKGIVLAKTDIILDTAAATNGRLLAQTAVTIRMASVTQPAP
jgi:3',5'-cyclic AMP phosphodiesterase CpdA